MATNCTKRSSSPQAVPWARWRLGDEEEEEEEEEESSWYAWRTAVKESCPRRW
jgi:hypothetical protein